MKCETYQIRSGYDGKKCLVHARCCYTPDFMIATGQYLDVSGSDLFEGILVSISKDEGKTWTEFKKEENLALVEDGDFRVVGCDATPMYHKASKKVLLLGHTAQYEKDGDRPTGNERKTFYSVYDEEKGKFSKMKFIAMPKGFERCGNGSGQSVELENGDLLIPVYYSTEDNPNKYSVMVIKCSFDGENIELKEMGNSHTIDIGRGLYEGSLIFHKGLYYLTMRNDQCGVLAVSEDGLNYKDMKLWCWDDGSILQNYNTQQHWFELEDELYLMYTRRGADNDHVFRHRAPLFASRVENMRLVRESEMAIIPERGARLGNFGVTSYKDGKAFAMAAEWMQPKGCEAYGSDNAIFISIIEL